MLSESADPLNLLAIQRPSTRTELNAVVFGGIMGRRDHATAVGMQLKQGEVEQGSRHQSDIHNIAAGCLQALAQRRTKSCRARPMVASHRQALAASLAHI